MKKIAIIGSTIGFLAIAGIAFASFSIGKVVSTGNTITSASPDLTVVSTPISIGNFMAGTSTPPTNITITNSGSYAGTVTILLSSITGNLCGDLSLSIAGDRTASYAAITNTTVSLGILNPGQTINLTQVATLKASSTLQGQNCTWNESASLSGN